MENIATIITSMAILLISFHVIKYLINKFREYKMVKNIPGPEAYPIIGNMNFFLGDMKDISHKIIKHSGFYKPLWRVWIGPKLIIFLNNPDYIHILTKSSYGINKSEFYEFGKYFVGNGLISAPTSIWKIHREVLQPGFKEQTLKTHTDSIVKNAIRFARYLENLNGKEINISHYSHLCTLDIVCESLFDCDLDLQNDTECKLPEYLSEGLRITMQRVIKFWLHPDIIFNYSSKGKRFRKINSILNEITDKIISKKKKSLEEDKIILNSAEPDTKKNTIIDILLKSFYGKGEYSEQDITDEIKTLLLAGSETVSIVITFVFLMLATFPDIQERVYEELYQMYESSDPEDVPVTYEDIRNMKVLERVLKETLRLFPPAPLIGRFTNDDIKVDDIKVIPKNCSVVLDIFTLHRNVKYWKDPLTFNPDRFLPGNYDPKCFLPFGVGKRDCIGQRFAMMELKGIIATVLRKFIVQVDNPVKIEDICLEFGISLRSVEPILLRFNRR